MSKNNYDVGDSLWYFYVDREKRPTLSNRQERNRGNRMPRLQYSKNGG